MLSTRFAKFAQRSVLGIRNKPVHGMQNRIAYVRPFVGNMHCRTIYSSNKNPHNKLTLEEEREEILREMKEEILREMKGEILRKMKGEILKEMKGEILRETKKEMLRGIEEIEEMRERKKRQIFMGRVIGVPIGLFIVMLMLG